MEEILAKFDEDGRRVASYVEGINFGLPGIEQEYDDEGKPIPDTRVDERKEALLAEGCIPISREDWELYCDVRGGENGTGYIRDPLTGRPVSAPAYVPSKEERMEAVRMEYEPQFEELKDAMATAMLSGDTELQDELKADYDALAEEYLAALREAN